MKTDGTKKSGIGKGSQKSSGTVRAFRKSGSVYYTSDVSSLKQRSLVSGKEADKQETPAPTLKPVEKTAAPAAKQETTGIKAAVQKNRTSSPAARKGKANTWRRASENYEKAAEAYEKDKTERKKRRGVTTAVLAVTLIALIAGACVGIYYLTLVRRISVVGCQSYTPTEIINAAELYTGKCILAYDTDAIQKKLSADPYLDVMSVKRIYPDEIRITVSERSEYAAVVTGSGTYCITDRSGFILYTGRRDNIEGLLPVYGLGTMGFSTGRYINEDRSMLRPYVLMELIEAFGARDGEIASVDLSMPASVKIETKDGYKVMFGEASDIAAKTAKMFDALDKARNSGSANKTIYINSSGSIDLSGGSASAKPSPTNTPKPTEAPETTEEPSPAETGDTAPEDTP